MTREKAIEVLKKNRPGADPRRCGLELCTAVDVAIAALREQEKLESKLRALESSRIESDTVKNGWISVEERLPRRFERVLVWDEEEDAVGEAEYNGEGFEWVEDENIAFATHWMPLPEPPKEEV